MLRETDFKWHIRFTNNIRGNPLDCEYCIVNHGDGKGTMYVVQPKYPQDNNGQIDSSNGYKYFVFFVCDVELSAGNKNDLFQGTNAYSGYKVLSETFIAVFDTMEDAKKRAYTQYRHHYGYMLAHVVDDTEEATKEHFVVQHGSTLRE